MSSSASTAPRVVLITGASRGIGRGTAIAFAEEGARIAINYATNSKEAETTAELVATAGGDPLVVRADMAMVSDIRRMVSEVASHFGTVDVLVLNAGICPFRPFFEIDEVLWDRVHAVNLKGAFFLSQVVAKTMVDRGRGGRIIAISSISALVGGTQQAHYCPSKAGLSSLMKCLAVILGPYGITCNAVLSGTVETDINRDDLAAPGKREYMIGRIPLGRLGEPRDIADVVRLLSHGDARYVNGAQLIVDGGALINFQ